MVRKFTDPSKRFFLELAVDAIEDVNRLIDSNNMFYARKSMIICGLPLEIDGTWTTNQLLSHLQEIIAKHQAYFEGLKVPQVPRAH